MAETVYQRSQRKFREKCSELRRKYGDKDLLGFRDRRGRIHFVISENTDYTILLERSAGEKGGRLKLKVISGYYLI